MAEFGAAKAIPSWNKALAAAQAKLGKKGKLPKPKEDPKVSLTKSAALAKTVDDLANQLLGAINSYQTALSDVEGACDSYSGQIAKDEFGLKIGDTDDEKLINAARNILSKELGDIGLGSKSPRKESAKLKTVLTSADLTTF
jgi:hypothetical protein